jgi:hypothetical protein
MRSGFTADEDCMDQVFFGYFQRDAKKMQEVGLPVYWLGRDFTAANLKFKGPYGVGFGGEVTGGGIEMHYTAWLESTSFEGPTTSLDITVYSADAWKLAEDRIENPRLLSNEGRVTRQTVTIGGAGAELLSIPAFLLDLSTTSS